MVSFIILLVWLLIMKQKMKDDLELKGVDSETVKIDEKSSSSASSDEVDAV